MVEFLSSSSHFQAFLTFAVTLLFNINADVIDAARYDLHEQDLKKTLKHVVEVNLLIRKY
jgi:hypothetical protein